MSKKKKDSKKNRIGVVYSSNPDFEYIYGAEDEEAEISPGEQSLRIFLDRKKRKGKEVTLICGFKGPDSSLKELGSFLKSKWIHLL